jgi:hypothetical protein
MENKDLNILIQKQIQKQIKTFKSLVDEIQKKHWVWIPTIAKKIWVKKQWLYYYYNDVLIPAKIWTLELIIMKIKKEFNL